MKTSLKCAALKLAGLIFCTVPVVCAVLLYFPLWKSKGGEAVLSGFTVLLTVLCFVPLFKLIKKLLRSPSAYTMWLIIFIAFFALSNIADEMTVISFVGFAGNLIGALLFKLAERGVKNQP